jgi:hypothetical protein
LPSISLPLVVIRVMKQSDFSLSTSAESPASTLPL